MIIKPGDTSIVKIISINSDKNLLIKKAVVRKLVSSVQKDLKKKINFIEINFVDESTIVKINSEYLMHNYGTDVISFDYSNESNSFDGEIFICWEIAQKNSKRFNVSLDDELKRLIIHGMLHFSGFDDTTESLRKIMKQKEDELLEQVMNFNLL